MKTRMDQAQFQHDCREQHFTAHLCPLCYEVVSYRLTKHKTSPILLFLPRRITAAHSKTGP